MYYRTYTVPYSHLLAELRPRLSYPYRMALGVTIQLHITSWALYSLHDEDNRKLVQPHSMSALHAPRRWQQRYVKRSLRLGD